MSNRLSNDEIADVIRSVDGVLRRDFDGGSDWRPIPMCPGDSLFDWLEWTYELDSLGELTFECSISRICGETPSRDEMLRWFDPPHMQDHPDLVTVPEDKRGITAMASWIADRRPLLTVPPMRAGDHECLAAGVFRFIESVTQDLTDLRFAPSTRVVDVFGYGARFTLEKRLTYQFGRNINLPACRLGAPLGGYRELASLIASVFTYGCGLAFGNAVVSLAGTGGINASVRRCYQAYRAHRSLTFGDLARSLAATA